MPDLAIPRIQTTTTTMPDQVLVVTEHLVEITTQLDSSQYTMLTAIFQVLITLIPITLLLITLLRMLACRHPNLVLFFGVHKAVSIIADAMLLFVHGFLQFFEPFFVIAIVIWIILCIRIASITLDLSQRSVSLIR